MAEMRSVNSTRLSCIPYSSFEVFMVSSSSSRTFTTPERDFGTSLHDCQCLLNLDASYKLETSWSLDSLNTGDVGSSSGSDARWRCEGHVDLCFSFSKSSSISSLYTLLLFSSCFSCSALHERLGMGSPGGSEGSSAERLAASQESPRPAALWRFHPGPWRRFAFETSFCLGLLVGTVTVLAAVWLRVGSSSAGWKTWGGSGTDIVWWSLGLMSSLRLLYERLE